MRRTIINVIASMSILTTVILTACASAKFEVSNMNVSPDPVGAGDVATVSVDVTNVGNAAGDYAATLKVNGDTIDAEDISLEPGVTEKVSFAVMEDELGVYDLGIGGLTGSLTVVKPAKLEVDALVITLAEVPSGESASITVDASNTGQVKGTFEVSLMVNGEKSQTKEVVIAGGETDRVIFTLTPETAGLYDIEIDGFKESLTVLKPAEFQLSSLRISPTEAVVGQEISIKVDVLNSGEVEGTHTVTLEVNGRIVES